MMYSNIFIFQAGKTNIPNTTVRETLREYPLKDQIEAIKHDLKIFNEKTLDVPYRLPQIENIRHRGTNDRILHNWGRAQKTRYQQLITDLKETTYSSYWKKPLGKTSDILPGLPQGMDAAETTFGHKPVEHPSLYEVILPNVPRYKVLYDSQVNHDNYKRIYNDYNLGEKIDRKYFKPPYNPNACAGYKSKNDERGLGVGCSIKWFNEEPRCVATERQVDFWETYHSKMAQKYTPIGNHNSVPKGHTYGRPLKREMHGMAELLKPGCEPSIYKRDTLERMKSLNMLRQNIKKKFTPTFTLMDFLCRLAYYDQEMTNFISLEKFYEVIACLKINMNRENLEALFEDVGIIQAGKIDYLRFIEAIDFNLEFGKQLDPLPKEKLNFCSESSAANLDRFFINNANEPAAGLSSYRFDLKIPPRKGCESERDHLPSDDVKALVDRSIFLQYNISYRDMFQVRTKEFIKTLFENCGYHFAEGAFDTLYKMALDADKTGSVCVDTFYKILKKNLPPPKRLVDELECLPKPMRTSCLCS